MPGAPGVEHRARLLRAALATLARDPASGSASAMVTVARHRLAVEVGDAIGTPVVAESSAALLRFADDVRSGAPVEWATRRLNRCD